MNFIKNFKKILCLFSHPDDETLGAGGLLSIANRNKIEINVAFSNTGITSRNQSSSLQLKNLSILKKNTYNALALFNLKKKDISFGKFPDNQSDKVPLLDIIRWCEKIIKKSKPDLILTHHRHCTNIDHRKLHEAVITATRPSLTQKCTVLSCEILSSTGYLKPVNFEPNLYLELTNNDLQTKLSAIKKYTTEIKKYPHPRSVEIIKALSMVRGSECGNKFAEAFIINKLISN